MPTIKEYVKSLDPEVLIAIMTFQMRDGADLVETFDDLCKHLDQELHLINGEYNDSREKHALTSRINGRHCDIFNRGYVRGGGRYCFYYWDPQQTKYRFDNKADVSIFDTMARIQKSMGFGSIGHKCQLITSIRRLVEANNVYKFMVGKTSSDKAKHLHTGMVNRFSKYREEDYQILVGLAILDYQADKDAEAKIIGLESYFHSVFGSHAKFDSSLSNAQSGNLTKSHKTYQVLYLALKQIQVVDTDEDDDEETES